MFLHLKIAKGGLQTTVGNKRDAFVERGYSETQCHRMTGTHLNFFCIIICFFLDVNYIHCGLKIC